VQFEAERRHKCYGAKVSGSGKIGPRKTRKQNIRILRKRVTASTDFTPRNGGRESEDGLNQISRKS
jgi:hypothetical protein